MEILEGLRQFMVENPNGLFGDWLIAHQKAVQWVTYSALAWQIVWGSLSARWDNPRWFGYLCLILMSLPHVTLLLTILVALWIH